MYVDWALEASTGEYVLTVKEIPLSASLKNLPDFLLCCLLPLNHSVLLQAFAFKSNL
jgi:hypothetical protein